ncbi:hypothetical protein [Microvirga subterranea]|uniref:hypothetical protein n=1 Tax=Microvirga subterranea TaxID=186651 RepID=UPI000E0ACDC0|nr:hypothetical protein [Microvirga subterranea]
MNSFAAAARAAQAQRHIGNREEDRREKGGESLTSDGNPTASAEAACALQTRDSISGEYRIASVEHSITWHEGYVMVLELKQPGGGVGKDSHSKEAGNSSDGGEVIDGSLPE